MHRTQDDAAHPPERLTPVDDAFLRLRRVWSAKRQGLVLNDGTPVDMSGLLIIEACAQGERQGRVVSVGDAARLLDVAPSTASRLVDRAAEAGLVTKQPMPGQRSRVLLELTATGRVLQQRALAARLGWLQRQLSGWQEHEVELFGQLLLRFADQLDASPAEPPAAEPRGQL